MHMTHARATCSCTCTCTGGLAEPGEVCLVMPLWRKLRPVVLPLLQEVVGRRLGLRAAHAYVWRVQLTRMPRGSTIGEHRDQGPYAVHAHRLHIPLLVPRCVRFEHQSASGRWLEVPMRESMAFEINNRIPHRVLRKGLTPAPLSLVASIQCT